MVPYASDNGARMYENRQTGSDIALGDTAPVSIVLVEDHVILRDGLQSLLNTEGNFNVIGAVGSCDAAIAFVTDHRPELVITDIALPGRSGLTLIPELKALDESIRVLVLTAHCTDEYVREALNCGADGYVLKDASRAELVRAINTIMSGETYFSTTVTSRVVSGFLGHSSSGGSIEAPITPRETEVLTLIASAYSTKEIARKLDLSVKTVEKHRSNLMRKLGLRSSAAVTLYAVQNNYLPDDIDPRKGPNDCK